MPILSVGTQAEGGESSAGKNGAGFEPVSLGQTHSPELSLGKSPHTQSWASPFASLSPPGFSFVVVVVVFFSSVKWDLLSLNTASSNSRRSGTLLASSRARKTRTQD